MKTIDKLRALSAAEIDAVSGGDLGLPNGKTMFGDFDNAAPGDFHPAITNISANSKPAELNLQGPWMATRSPAIDLEF